MINLRNFKRYNKYPEPDGYVYMISDEGIDWYDVRDSFRKDTVKIMYIFETNVIVCASRDVIDIIPLDYCVAEVEYEGDAKDLYGMIYDGEKAIPYVESSEEKIERLTYTHTSLKTQFINELNTLKMAIDLDVATESEVELFPKLKQYVIELSKLTASDFEKDDFEFPVKPV